MQQPPRHEGKRAGDEKAEHIHADHVGLVRLDIAAARGAPGDDGADDDIQAQQMNETKMVEEARPDLGRHEQRGGSGKQDQAHKQSAQQFVGMRALSAQHEDRSQHEGGYDGKKMQIGEL